MLALRSKRFFGGRVKEVLRSFNYGQAKREEMHKMSNLPTKEKKEYLRKQEVIIGVLKFFKQRFNIN